MRNADKKIETSPQCISLQYCKRTEPLFVRNVLNRSNNLNFQVKKIGKIKQYHNKTFLKVFNTWLDNLYFLLLRLLKKAST